MIGDAYKAPFRHGQRGWPQGPIGSYESPHPVAIGYCTWCGTNARQTCSVRGIFDCPNCVHAWFDHRVGKQQWSFETYFSKVTDGGTEVDQL